MKNKNQQKSNGEAASDRLQVKSFLYHIYQHVLAQFLNINDMKYIAFIQKSFQDIKVNDLFKTTSPKHDISTANETRVHDS